eukprot:TRINITY_DN9327_c0_g2_i1.p1 TRINITY_DN9327_c0_g2~~TRINITY_DN9327_c0_g2_i1.p1  ORF type:complete len:141 (+),score=17.49 TRINITY_DN9327_c0_g2_i1:84-506(+)
MHQGFLNDQYEAYKHYLEDVREKCSAANSKDKGKKKAARSKTIGPFKYPYNQLVKEGIIKESLVPKDRRNHITFAFSSSEPGVYLVEVSWRGKKISSLQLLLDDLLERRQENAVDYDTEFLKLDVNLLLHLLNKHFVLPK